MPAELATVEDLGDWLDEDLPEGSSAGSRAQKLLDALEAALEHVTGQTFTAGGTVTDEAHNGHASRSVRLDRPVDDLRVAGSELKIGPDPADPIDTVDLTDPEAATLDPDNPRRVHLRQRVLPHGVGNVHVTYEAADNLPALARLAVLQAAAGIWEGRGLEGVRQVSLGRSFSYTLRAAEEESEAWRRIVDEGALIEPVLG